MPQPSSALWYCGAAPTEKVGILSRKKFRPWSLYTTTATSGFTSSSQRWMGGKASKNGFQYGSFCRLPAMARPMAGTWEVTMLPTIFAMIIAPRSAVFV
jgi:hypothetical protein